MWATLENNGFKAVMAFMPEAKTRRQKSRAEKSAYRAMLRAIALYKANNTMPCMDGLANECNAVVQRYRSAATLRANRRAWANIGL